MTSTSGAQGEICHHAPPMAAAVETVELVKEYGDTVALDHINLRVAR